MPIDGKMHHFFLAACESDLDLKGKTLYLRLMKGRFHLLLLSSFEAFEVVRNMKCWENVGLF